MKVLIENLSPSPKLANPQVRCAKAHFLKLALDPCRYPRRHGIGRGRKTSRHPSSTVALVGFRTWWNQLCQLRARKRPRGHLAISFAQQQHKRPFGNGSIYSNHPQAGSWACYCRKSSRLLAQARNSAVPLFVVLWLVPSLYILSVINTWSFRPQVIYSRLHTKCQGLAVGFGFW